MTFSTFKVGEICIPCLVDSLLTKAGFKTKKSSPTKKSLPLRKKNKAAKQQTDDQKKDDGPELIWLAKIDASYRAEFKEKVLKYSAELGIDPNDLMAVMAFESGFDPARKNMAGSSGTGLIQFMRDTAIGLGTTIDELAKMTAVQQMDYVRKYLDPYKGKMKDLDDLYMAVLWPSAIGKPSEHAIFTEGDKKRPKAYPQNKGLDYNKDGKVTKGEAAAKVRATYSEGESFRSK